MNVWNQDLYVKAWNFASSFHIGQTVPGTNIPYLNHIGLVAMEAMTAVAAGTPIYETDLLIACALLHDAIEDTHCRYEYIHMEFGMGIANGVAALSKDGNISNKTEQMHDSLRRIQEQPKEVWMVKMADRITNLQPPPKHWERKKIAEYREEAKLILNELGTSNVLLSQRLESKIEYYRKYIDIGN